MWLITYVFFGLLTGAILLWSGKDDLRKGSILDKKKLIFSMVFFPTIWVEALILGMIFIGWRSKR